VKIKLDENLGPGIARLFADAGHDVCLVREQGLSGKPGAYGVSCSSGTTCLLSPGACQSSVT
jgi:hypothetical protein